MKRLNSIGFALLYKVANMYPLHCHDKIVSRAAITSVTLRRFADGHNVVIFI